MKKILKYLLILIGIITSGCLIKIVTDLDVLPSKYYWTFIIVILILNVLASVTLLVKKIWTKVFSVFIYLIIFVVSFIGIDYGTSTLKFFNEGFDNDLKEVTTYNVVVLSDSNYNKLSDLENKVLGYLSIGTFNDNVLSYINKNIKSDLKDYKDMYSLYDDLTNKKVSAMIIDEVYLDILEEEYEDIKSKVKVIDTFEIEDINIVNNSSNSNSNNNSNSTEKIDIFDIDNGSINIYISGSDSRSGTIKSRTRTDVNMIMTINPNTKTILLTSIPRDYYVRLHGTSGLKDKLTHSGVYGIDMSKNTIEDLFGIKIDYTIKVGFKSVIKLVDLVGGIDVYSDTSFTSHCSDGGAKSVKVVKGMNHFDGAEALSYARERYAYQSGDVHRIQNQQQVIEAIIKKITTNKSLLLKYEELLNTVKSLYRTDMPNSVIKSYIKNQLNDMSSWKIEKQYVSGRGAKKQTYSMPGRNLYVMIPDSDSVTTSRNNIISVMKGN